MIFYFSGTGNTRWAAFKVASATHDRLIDIAEETRTMKLQGLTTTRTFVLEPDERLGFIFPVHGWRVPRLVRDFIGKLQFQRKGEQQEEVGELHKDSAVHHGTFAYAVCTAGDSIGLTIENLNNVLAANGSLADLGIRKVDSAYSLIMPESYVGLPFMDVDTKEKERQKKDRATHELDSIVMEIANCKKNISQLKKGFWPWMMTKVVGGFFEHVLITDKRFHVTRDKCVKCGICANVCPVHDIDGGKGKYPAWKHQADCLTCFSCYHHCPHHAIEFGHQTQKKGQYYYR